MTDIRHETMRIGGEHVDTDARIEVRYPYTDEVIGTVPAGTAEHARRAFEIAANYKPKLTRYERSQILQKAGEIIGKKRDYLAKWLTLELGICHQHAIYETKRAQDVYQFAAAEALKDDGEIFSCDLTHNGKARKIFTMREPVRAISAITPFNHPLNMVSHKIAPSIATNNCMVCKPTELTPLTALTLADILYEAGLPPEMFQVVTGMPADIGDEMVTNENIDIITFTGGVPVGKLIASKAGYKRTALELGGNDPLIVCNDLSDADLDKAATIAVAGATGNSGQRCTAIKRILVQESVADRFVPLVLEKAKKIKFGDPQDPATELGCVIHAKAAELFEKRVYMAAEQGAKVLYDPGRKGALLPPIVVDHVPHDSELVMEETFGPIIPIVRVPDDDAEVMRISNSTDFGLSSGVCTNDLNRAIAYINGLNVGTCNIWEQPGYRIEMSPFGGIKDSGNGVKEGVIEAMKFFTNVKTYKSALALTLMGFTHKILWMSDLHQTVSGQVEGVAGGARLQQVIDQMNRYHPDATCCVASGDLTDTGDAAEYAVLGDALSKLTVPVLPMIGNHDNRANLMAALPRPGSGPDGYYQYRFDLEGGVTLLCLDTAVHGSDAGEIDAARLAWLGAELSRTSDRRVLVFAHHPPGPLGLGLLDDMPLLDHQPLMGLLATAPQVEHLFCGHVHRPVSGVIGGIPFTALRSIAHQTRPPHQDWDWSNFVALIERPQYGVILIGADRIVVQMTDIEDPA